MLLQNAACLLCSLPLPCWSFSPNQSFKPFRSGLKIRVICKKKPADPFPSLLDSLIATGTNFRLQNCSSSSSLQTEHCLHTTFPKSMGLFRLEKTFQIKSSSSPSTKCPWEPHPHGFSIPAGVVAPSLPCSLPSLPWTQQSCCFVPLEIAPQTPGSFGHRVGSSLTVPRVLRPWAITLKSFQTISHPLDQLMSPQAVCLLCECLFLTSWLKTLWGTLEMCSLWNQTGLKLIPKAAGQLSPHPMQSLLWQLRLQKWILCAAHAISTSCAKSSLFIINQFC